MREIPEGAKGEFDEYDFFWLDDESGYYDPDGYFFAKKDDFKDEFGGSYNDDLEYIPAVKDDFKKAYKEQDDEEMYRKAISQYDFGEGRL